MPLDCVKKNALYGKKCKAKKIGVGVRIADVLWTSM